MKQYLSIANSKYAITILLFTLINTSCKKDGGKTPDYCTDQIQNNGETGVDCGGSCIPCNNTAAPSKTYYLQFNSNGSYTTYQTDEPQYELSKGSALTDFALVFNADYGVAIKFSGDVKSLAGKTLSFDTLQTNSVKILFYDAAKSSAWATDQTNSDFYIESVEVTDSLLGIIPVYAVRGTFSCNVAGMGNANMEHLTEGKFSVMAD